MGSRTATAPSNGLEQPYCPHACHEEILNIEERGEAVYEFAVKVNV